MEWKEIDGKHCLFGYYGSIDLCAYIFQDDAGDWLYSIGSRQDWMEGITTLEEARTELLVLFAEHCRGKIGYYQDLYMQAQELEKEGAG